MNTHRRSRLVAVLACTLIAWLSAISGHSRPAWGAVGLDVGGNLAAAIAAAHLPEPLIPTGRTSPAEDEALRQTLAVYESRAAADDVSALSGFASAYPESGWAPAVLTNLGLAYLHNGYFSLAADAWQRAWHAGLQATEPHAAALVDRSVGELARLKASLGHMDSLAALFDEIGDRPVRGSATEMVQTAREELSLVQKDPRHLFICGPMALRSLMLAQGESYDRVRSLQWYQAGRNGTSLAEVSQLALKSRFSHRLVYRAPGQPVPLRAIVHWRVGHFAAIVGEANGRFHIEDPVFPGQELWVTQAALDHEASGYFLVPQEALAAGTAWRAVDDAEAAGIWGKGPTNGTSPGAAGAQDPPANRNGGGNGGAGSPNGGDNPPAGCPLCGYNIGESTVSVTLSDTPVGYTPPIGPSVKVKISYTQREDSQSQNANFFNVSPKWTLNWLTYVVDDPGNPGASVTRYLSGGGAYYYTGYNSQIGTFRPQQDDGSVLALTSKVPVTYQRQLRDGSIEVYAQSNGSTGYPRNIFLSQVIDPQGNAVTLHYDTYLGQQRLVSLTDATGRQTTFNYGSPGQPLLITQITDPFGRSATLGYDGNQRLVSITDILGLTSRFTYDANALVNSLATPYGTTQFAYTAPGATGPPRFVQITDPLGYNEREEWLEPAPIPDSDPAATVPTGMPVPPINQFLTYRNSFHWDKNAYIVAGCTPTGGCDYAKARDTHFHHVPNSTLKATTIESVKNPLENRIWFTYPGQSNPPGSIFSGTYGQPNAIARVLDDGTTQLSQFSYDATGYFNRTQTIDPAGRITSFAYANHVDLAAISQTTAFGVQQTIAQFAYDTKHRPVSYTDAAGQTTRFVYNAAGQVNTITNPLGQTTRFQYGASNDLMAVVNANNMTAASFTYDGYDRVRTYADSEGWTVTYDYDAADRITKITYPDGTADVFIYDRLDLASHIDRQGRVWTYAHDANRRLTQITDPLGRPMRFGYTPTDRLSSLTDPKNQVTRWTYDVESRLTLKTYADASTVAYTYEAATSRLKSITDALGQVKTFSYKLDDRIAAVTYTNAVNPTPNVAFFYDPYFPRLASMADGSGTTQYAYAPVGVPGALRLQQERGPLANSAIAYAYDPLGRLASRTVAGAGAESFGYDPLGRLTAHASDLGSFTLGYLGQTGQIMQRQLANSTLATRWAYLPNAGDRRLASVANTGLASGQYANFAFTTTSDNLIQAIGETSDTPAVYPPVGTQSASYNNLNQLMNLTGQARTYDANGNLLSDGQRTYSWDAENRLVGITYPGVSGKATAFTYDGLGRRTAITDTAAGGGSAVTQSYLWCGTSLCQARNAGNAPVRAYYPEGEFVPGSPGQTFYYAPDQLGSVRRVFAGVGGAPAYAYDPYGNQLQATAPQTDFTYAGLFYHAGSGLLLARYRAYDPVSGRWLSRDPIGEGSDPAANLYTYIGNQPLSLVDPLGLWGFGITGSASVEAGLGVIGAGANASAGVGVFGGGGSGPNVGGFAGGGAFAGGPGYGVGIPGPQPGGTTATAVSYLGAGGGVFFTNANNAEQLGGAFNTYSFNLGVGPIQFSAQFAYSDGTWLGSFTFGPGYGLSGSTYPTTTPFAGTLFCL